MHRVVVVVVVDGRPLQLEEGKYKHVEFPTKLQVRKKIKTLTYICFNTWIKGALIVAFYQPDTQLLRKQLKSYGLAQFEAKLQYSLQLDHLCT